MNRETNRTTTPLQGQRLVLWVLWITYGSFYFCRQNLSVAVPGIADELKLDKSDLGKVLMALKLAYGAGQFINGQLAERISPKRLLAIGLLASAVLNVVFGFATSLYFMIFVWACNGYVQSLGWPPTMRVTANWFNTRHHGRAIGLIGTGYQLCGTLTYFLSGWAAGAFGWRGVLFVPSALLVISAIHMWCFMEERPGVGDSPATSKTPPAVSTNRLGKNIALTLANPALWFVGIALWLLDACRYGFTDWGVTHLKEVQATTVSSAAFKYAVLPLGGIVGTLVSGWVTDRFFLGRRVPAIFTMLVALGLLANAYDRVIHWGLIPSVTILFLIGFCIFGSQVLLVGTLPVDLAKNGTAAAGFVNFMGYMGAAGGDYLTGKLAQAHGWALTVRFWAGCALAGAIAVGCIWNRERQLRMAKNNNQS